MPTEAEVYQRNAAEYDLLVSREDYAGNIRKAIDSVLSVQGKEVIETGAGTGRLAGLLAEEASCILSMDASAHMLAYAKNKLAGEKNIHYALADHRSLPVSNGRSRLVITGWSLCYLVTWNSNRWKSPMKKALKEMERAAGPGGTIIILETQGTGFTSPNPPEHLKEYYTYLVSSEGFRYLWMRTDYRFESVEEAGRLTEFFFGENLCCKMVDELTLPECTGLWWKKSGL